MTDGFSVLAIEKSRWKEGSFREMGLFPSIFVAERTKCLGCVGRISECFKKNVRHFRENLPRFFKKLRRFCENLPRFSGSVGYFLRGFCLQF